MTTLNTEKTVAIDKDYHWRKIDRFTPRGVKLQLINENAGVASYGILESDPWFWTHFCPVPTFKKDGK